MATVRRTPTGKWQAQVYLGKDATTGKPRFRTKTKATKAQADAWARTTEADRDAFGVATKAQVDAAEGRLTVGAYWRDVVLPHRRVQQATATVKRNVSHWVNHVEPTFGGRPLVAVRRAEVKTWVTEMLAGTDDKAPAGVPTVEASLHLLSAIYAQAIDDELADTNPATGIRLPAHEPADKGYVSREDVAHMLEHVAEPYRLFLELSAETGLRFGEAAGLTPEHVLGDARQVRVRKVWTRDGLKDLPKNSASRRVVPVPPYLRARLATLVLATPAGCVIFTGPRGGGLSDSNLRQRILGRACETAGIPRLTPHGLRHAYTSWLTEAGVSPFDVAGALGHSSTRMLERYNHLAPGHDDRVLAGLEASRRGATVAALATAAAG